MDGEDQDLEEIMNPQLVYVAFVGSYHVRPLIDLTRQPSEDAERKLFRRVHIVHVVSYLVK
jgi:hypothetical protein